MILSKCLKAVECWNYRVYMTYEEVKPKTE